MPVPYLATGGGAILGGLLNALSGQDERRKQRQAIKKTQELLAESKTSGTEIARGESRISRYFNANISNVLNSTALQTRGVVNAPVVAAAAVAPIAGQSAMAQSEYRTNQINRNQDIDRQIAMVGLNQPSGSVIGEFFSGAIQGGIAGSQIASLLPKGDEEDGEDGTTSDPTDNTFDPSKTLPIPNIQRIGGQEVLRTVKAPVIENDILGNYPGRVATKGTKTFTPEMKDNFKEITSPPSIVAPLLETEASESRLEQMPNLFNENPISDMVAKGKRPVKYNMNYNGPTSYGFYGRMKPQNIPNPISSFFDWLGQPRSTGNNASDRYLQFRGY